MFVDWSKCTSDKTADGVATLSCLPYLMQVVVFWAIAFAGVVALFLIIFAGYKFMTSQGDPKALDGARKTLTYGILGLFLIFLSFLIINVISFVTGASCIQNFGFKSCVVEQDQDSSATNNSKRLMEKVVNQVLNVKVTFAEEMSASPSSFSQERTYFNPRLTYFDDLASVFFTGYAGISTIYCVHLLLTND